MAREIRGVAPSGTLYARIISPAGLWWNGTSFESYASGNYATYVVAMTEQGNSGVYVADFPTGITRGGTYEIFIHRTTTSAAEGDQVVNTAKIDWTGTTSISSATGSMTGSDWRDYVLRCGFKRTDKDTELYEATTDAIQEMRRRFMFDEAETETTTTDTISVLGNFKIDVESDLGLILNVKLEDDDTGTVLHKMTKSQFDDAYPSADVDNTTGYPKAYCIYGGQIYIGPIPDQTSYVYRVSYSRRAGTITSSTTGVPFTNLYRDALCENVISRLYHALEDYDKSDRHKAKFEEYFAQAKSRERQNSGEGFFNVRPFGC